MIKNTFTAIYNWLVISSEDPTKTSTTLVGLLVGGGVYLIYIGSLFHLTFTTVDVTTAAEQLGSIVSLGLVGFGMARKLYHAIVSLVQYLYQIWQDAQKQ